MTQLFGGLNHISEASVKKWIEDGKHGRVMLAIKQSHGIKRYLQDEGNRAAFVRVARDLGTVFNKLDLQLPKEAPRIRETGGQARRLGPWQPSNVQQEWFNFIEGKWDKAQKTLNAFISNWHGWVTAECTPAKLRSYQDKPADTQARLDRKANQQDMCRGLNTYNAQLAVHRAPLARPKVRW